MFPFLMPQNCDRSTLPWGLCIDDSRILQPFKNTVDRHPFHAHPSRDGLNRIPRLNCFLNEGHWVPHLLFTHNLRRKSWPKLFILRSHHQTWRRYYVIWWPYSFMTLSPLRMLTLSAFDNRLKRVNRNGLLLLRETLRYRYRTLPVPSVGLPMTQPNGVVVGPTPFEQHDELSPPINWISLLKTTSYSEPVNRIRK